MKCWTPRYCAIWRFRAVDMQCDQLLADPLTRKANNPAAMQTRRCPWADGWVGRATALNTREMASISSLCYTRHMATQWRATRLFPDQLCLASRSLQLNDRVATCNRLFTITWDCTTLSWLLSSQFHRELQFEKRCSRKWVEVTTSKYAWSEWILTYVIATDINYYCIKLNFCEMLLD